MTHVVKPSVSYWLTIARHAELRRKTPMQRGPAPRRSKRNGVPPKVRAAVVDRCRGQCERCGGWVGLEPELHHKVKRSQGGPHTEANLAALCHECHSWAEANPAAAVAEGVSVQRTDRGEAAA